MSGFLFVVPPLAGHVNPTVGVAAELVRRGHRVAWAGAPEAVRPMVGERALVFPCSAETPDGPGAPWRAQRRPAGPAALEFLWEGYLGPLAVSMAPGVRAAVERFRPDVLVADQQAYAGGLVAEQLGVPWATSATTSAELTVLGHLPKVAAQLAERIQSLRQRIGAPDGSADPRLSDRLALVFSTAELTGPAEHFGRQVRLVGPSIEPRPTACPFPWRWLDRRRATVLITLGTLNADAGARFLAECATAVRGRSERLQAVIVDPSGSVRGSADGVLACARVPQLALLERCSAVICHGGHNTVCESLWHGLPLVLAPIRDDQPAIAGQVVRAGAGLRVRYGRAAADRIGAALDAVLHEPGYRAAARRVARSFRAAGGAAAAATHLEHLVPREPSDVPTPA